MQRAHVELNYSRVGELIGFPPREEFWISVSTVIEQFWFVKLEIGLEKTPLFRSDISSWNVDGLVCK